MCRGCLLGIALLVALGRFTIEPQLCLPIWEGSYEALAHLYVGALIGYWLARRGTVREKVDGRGRCCLDLAIGLTVFEVVMFVLQKFGVLP